VSKHLISESFFILVEQPNAGQGRLSLEILRSHTTHHSRQDFSGRVQPDNKEHSHDPVEIQTPNPSKRAAADSRLRLLDTWDRLRNTVLPYFNTVIRNADSHSANSQTFTKSEHSFPCSRDPFIGFYPETGGFSPRPTINFFTRSTFVFKFPPPPRPPAMFPSWAVSFRVDDQILYEFTFVQMHCLPFPPFFGHLENNNLANTAACKTRHYSVFFRPLCFFRIRSDYFPQDSIHKQNKLIRVTVSGMRGCEFILQSQFALLPGLKDLASHPHKIR
jgi:hypothetical protein